MYTVFVWGTLPWNIFHALLSKWSKNISVYTSLWPYAVLFCIVTTKNSSCAENNSTHRAGISCTHTTWALQVERRICVITQPVYVNEACLSAPQHRQSCQSSPSRVPLIWPHSNAWRDMTGSPSATGITRLAEMCQTNLSSSLAILIPFFSVLFPFPIFQSLLTFFFSLSSTHSLQGKKYKQTCELLTSELQKKPFAIIVWTPLGIYLEKLLQI